MPYTLGSALKFCGVAHDGEGVQGVHERDQREFYEVEDTASTTSRSEFPLGLGMPHIGVVASLEQGLGSLFERLSQLHGHGAPSHRIAAAEISSLSRRLAS